MRCRYFRAVGSRFRVKDMRWGSRVGSPGAWVVTCQPQPAGSAPGELMAPAMSLAIRTNLSARESHLRQRGIRRFSDSMALLTR